MNDRVHPAHWFYLILSLLCQVAAIVMGKMAALRLGRPALDAFLTSPWYLGGLACLIMQAFLWQLVLRSVRLFVAYLVTSLNSVLVLAASRVFFQERVSVANIVGAAVIAAGVYFVMREDLR